MPHPVLTRIIGKPNRRNITLLKCQLLANALSIPSNGGDGLLGLSRLVLTAPEYAAASNGGVPYVTPIKPVLVDHALNANADTMHHSEHTYKIEMIEWESYYKTKAKLTQQILAAVDDTYTKALSHSLWHYGNVTPLQLLTHLSNTYGRILPRDLQDNRAKMTEPWDGTSDIETVFDRINSCISFSEDGGDPISNMNAVHAGVAIFQQTGLFSQAIREWNQKPEADQTLANYIDFFRTAEEERQAEATTTAAGYHHANAADTHTMVTDASSITAATMATTMATLQQMMAQAAAATAAANAVTAAAAAAAPQGPPGRQPRGAPTATEIAAMGYCWTHGHCHNPAHTSGTCMYKADGHVDTATAANKQGGNTERYDPRPRGPRR